MKTKTKQYDALAKTCISMQIQIDELNKIANSLGKNVTSDFMEAIEALIEAKEIIDYQKEYIKKGHSKRMDAWVD